MTTEKDWVRLPAAWRERVTAWPVQAVFEDDAALDRLLAKAGIVSRVAPAFLAKFQLAWASDITRSACCAACGLLAVPSRTRPTMPWRMPARRKAL